MNKTFAFGLAFVFSVLLIATGLAQRAPVDGGTLNAPLNGQQVGNLGPTVTQSATASVTPTFTSTPCPTTTPEPFWVEAVTSPTELLTQTIEVMIGNGEVVTVTAESGEFVETGMFGTFNPAEVEIDLLPNTTHHLTVQGKVRVIEQGDCTFGGYVLSTTFDRFGESLEIVQEANTPTPTPTFTGTPCPMPTPVPLWVEPITSPTELLTQTIEVRIGNGEAVTVTAESGIFALTGEFDLNNNPALVEIDLLPNTTHNLTVEGKVRASQVGGCIYESYTRSTTLDRFGDPLMIVQQSNSPTPTPTSTPTISPIASDWKLYLPMIVR